MSEVMGKLPTRPAGKLDRRAKSSAFNKWRADTWCSTKEVHSQRHRKVYSRLYFASRETPGTMTRLRPSTTGCAIMVLLLAGVGYAQQEAGEDSVQGMIEKVRSSSFPLPLELPLTIPTDCTVADSFDCGSLCG
jgi:hypothetical protein